MSSFDYLLDILYPPTCLICGQLQVPGNKIPLCPKCQEQWERLRRSHCPDCGKPQTLCKCMPSLLNDLVRGVECVHLVPYEQNSVAGRLILTAKDEYLPYLTDFFTDQMLSVLAARDISVDGDKFILTYLPRSGNRARETGVDQSRSLAKSLGKRLGLPLSKCFSRRSAPPQKDLDATERLRMARRVYRLHRCCPSLEGTTVLLVDDVMTTGATMLAGVELLQAAGATKIYCLSVGQTLKSIHKDKK